MTKTMRDLNDLVGSRICHDLISPVGAIGNGIELLTLSGIAQAPEIALIAESVENANARIRFFRIAFGAAPDDALLGASEIQSVLHDLYRNARCSVHWRIRDDQRRCEVKLAFLLLQCLEGALPWGGTITVTKTSDRWNLAATGERLKIEEPLWDVLTDPTRMTDIVAADVHFALAPHAAARIDRRIFTNIGSNAIALTF